MQKRRKEAARILAEYGVDPERMPGRLPREVVCRYYKTAVCAMANKLRTSESSMLDIEDFISLGFVGLLEAIESYDESKGRFFTWANIRIRGAILDGLRSFDFVSRGARKLIHSVDTAREELRQRILREPTVLELHEYLGDDFNLEEVRTQYFESYQKKYLSEMNAAQEASTHLEHFNSNQDREDAQGPEVVAAKREVSEVLRFFISTLTPKYVTLMSLYYFENLDFKEIGARLGVSESRICQMHGFAIEKIKKRIEMAEIDPEELRLDDL